MNTAPKVISILTASLATSIILPSGYLIWSVKKDNQITTNRMVGREWLEENGYTFNKPTFKSQDHLRHGCSENLFSNTKGNFDPTSDPKLYGCSVMGMDVYNTEISFENSPKYIKFNSEIAIRKSDEGWVINSKIDNTDRLIHVEYILTTYKYNNNIWEKVGDTKWWSDSEGWANPFKITSINGKIGEIAYEVNVHNKKLVIKTPVGYWWNGESWIYPTGPTNIKKDALFKSKRWSGLWIDGSDKGEDSWIFKDIELYIDDRKYSKVFCKGEEGECFQETRDNNRLKRANNPNSDSWSEMWKNNSSINNTSVASMLKDDMKEIIDKLQNLRGKWTNLNEVCGLKEKDSPNEEQQKRLRMYCANGKSTV